MKALLQMLKHSNYHSQVLWSNMQALEYERQIQPNAKWGKREIFLSCSLADENTTQSHGANCSTGLISIINLSSMSHAISHKPAILPQNAAYKKKSKPTILILKALQRIFVKTIPMLKI